MIESFEKLEKVTPSLSVYQADGVFPYGTDAVLLSAFARGFIPEKKAAALCDLCSGTGIIGLLLLSQNPNLISYAVEINEKAFSLSERSAKISGLSERYFPVCCDICDIRKKLDAESCNYVVCNPPYMTDSCGYMCNEDYKTTARHETHCTLDNVFESAKYLLKTKGDLFLVYRPERMATLFDAAAKNNFHIKNITFVHSRQSNASNLILCRAKKGANEGLKISKPFIIYDSNNQYTEDMKEVSERGIMRFGK